MDRNLHLLCELLKNDKKKHVFCRLNLTLKFIIIGVTRKECDGKYYCTGM